MNRAKLLGYFFLFMSLLAALPYLLQRQYRPLIILIPNFWMLFAIFGAVTLTLLLLVQGRMRKSNQASGQALLASIAVRLIASILILVVYLNNIEVNPILFLLNFFYLYSLHRAFEIYCILRNLRHQISK